MLLPGILVDPGIQQDQLLTTPRLGTPVLLVHQLLLVDLGNPVLLVDLGNRSFHLTDPGNPVLLGIPVCLGIQ
jgi:hypothetical protein